MRSWRAVNTMIIWLLPSLLTAEDALSTLCFVISGENWEINLLKIRAGIRKDRRWDEPIFAVLYQDYKYKNIKQQNIRGLKQTLSWSSVKAPFILLTDSWCVWLRVWSQFVWLGWQTFSTHAETSETSAGEKVLIWSHTHKTNTDTHTHIHFICWGISLSAQEERT